MFAFHRNSAFRLSMLIAAICLGNIGALAQLATGSIQGVVTDKSGAVIPNATITVTNPATALSRTVQSNTDGLYTVPALPPGDYNITAEAKDFAKQVSENVVLRVNAKQVSISS